MLRLSAHGAPGGREGEGSVAAKDKRKRRVKTSCFVWNGCGSLIHSGLLQIRI